MSFERLIAMVAAACAALPKAKGKSGSDRLSENGRHLQMQVRLVEESDLVRRALLEVWIATSLRAL